MKRYAKIRILGRGAYGLAWLAKDLRDDCLVVIKELPLVSLSSAEREHALREANLLSQLSHPNIIPYRDSFLNSGALNIITGYANLGDLHHYIKDPNTTPQTVGEDFIVHVAVGILQALKYLHDNNVMHRDIKPANIFLTCRNKAMVSPQSRQLSYDMCSDKLGLSVMLGDFGIAKILEESATATTLIGTPYYLSPELVARKPYSKKSDIWSLGVTLYEIAAGKLPFTGRNIVEVAMQISGAQQERLPARYTPRFCELVSILLTKSADQRPSAKEALAQFQSLTKKDAAPTNACTVDLQLASVTIQGPYIDTIASELRIRHHQLYAHAQKVLSSSFTRNNTRSVDTLLKQILEHVLSRPSAKNIHYAVSQHFETGSAEFCAMMDLVVCIIHSWLNIGSIPSSLSKPSSVH